MFRDTPTPGEIEKHNLAPYERKRLIEKKVSFVVPGKQAYLWPNLVDFRERVQSPKNESKGNLLSAPAQTLVLSALLSPYETEDWPLVRWSEKLGYSSMSISRASRELQRHELCMLVDRGREVGVRFEGTGKSLWQRALPHLSNPVKKVTPVSILEWQDLHFLDAGLTALAEFSDLVHPQTRFVAGSESAFKLALEERKLRIEPFPDDETVAVQRWRYAPTVLSENGVTVDRFSLILSFPDETDERVVSALEGLLRW